MFKPIIIFFTTVYINCISQSLLADNNYIWFEAEEYVSGNFPKSTVLDSKKLSGEKWIITKDKEHPLFFARYSVDIKSDKQPYYFYTRKFWYHGPFRYRFNNNEWHYITRKNHPKIKDSIILNKYLSANWVELGKHTLAAGINILDIELTDTQGAAAFDSFVLSMKPFIPLGLRKPNEKFNLENNNFWSFEPDMDFFTNGALWDLRSLNETIAGEHGYVTLSPDKNSFLLGNNKPVRFWSINTSMQSGGNMTELDRHAQHLAKRGFNMARFHGNIYSKSDDINSPDQDEIEKSWRLVSSMKKQGIYTTLSAYWGIHAKPRNSWKLTKGNNKNLTGLLFFEPTLQKAYKNWLKQWLTTINPHTGISLAKDPAVAIFQIQNEDSLLFWTFNLIKGEQLRLLEKKFFLWAKKKYNTIDNIKLVWNNFSEKRDDFNNGYAGISKLYLITKSLRKNDKRQQRLNDQYQFLIETMLQWNKEIERFLREEIGYQGLINAGNWRTANNVTMLDGERWSYSSNQVMAVNKYYTGGIHINPTTKRYAGYRIKKDDYFQNQSGLNHPRKLPFNIKQVEGFPMIISESNWVSPMDYQSEAAFLVAAYSSLNGIDSYYWFSTDNERFLNNFSIKFGGASFPSIMTTYPAAALLFRKAYVKQAEPIISEHRSMADIWQRNTPLISEEPGFDPNRDKGLFHFLSSNESDINPLAFLVGPVVSHYNSDSKDTVSKPTDKFIDEDNQRITSSTKELVFDYKQGISTINAKKAQGVTGFLDKVSPIVLDNITITSSSHYATVLLVSLDEKNIQTSHKLLLQTTTRARPYNFSAKPTTFTNPHNKKDWRRYDGFQIENIGTPPFNIEEHNIEVAIHNQLINEAIMTDVNGYPLKTLTLEKTTTGVRLKLPKDAIYIVLKLKQQ